MAKKMSGNVNLQATLVANFESKGEEILQKKLDDVRQAVDATGKALEKMASGMDFSRYYNTAASSLDGVAEALQRVRDAGERVDSRQMQELIKSVNSFQAMAKIRGEDPSEIFVKFGQELKTAYNQAKEYMPQFAQLWSVDEFESAFQVMRDSTALFGRDMDAVFSKINEADASGYRRMCAELRVENEKLKNDVIALREELESIGAGNGSKLQKQIEDLQSKLGQVTRTAANEFAQFLRGNELSEYDNRFNYLFESISAGTMTAREAIAQCKYDFAHLFEGQDTGLAEQLIARFEAAAQSIEDLRKQIVQMRNDLAQAGIGTGEGNFEATVDGETQAIRREGEALSELKAHTDGLGETVDLIRRLSEHLANAGNGAGAQAIAEALTQMMSALQDFASVDSDKLTTISSALYSIQNMNGFKANGKALSELTNMMSTLSGIEHTGTSVLDRLSAIDFRNLQNLKVSKASLENLSNFLPSISNINVGGLETLANINWGNLNGLKVDKGSIDAIKGLGSTLAANAFKFDATTLTTLSQTIQEAIQKASENIKLTIGQVELSAAVKQQIADEVAVAASAGTKARTGSVVGGRKQAVDDETAAIERQTDAMWKAYEAEKALAEQKERESGWKAADAMAKEEAAQQKEIDKAVEAANAYYAKGDAAQAASEAAQKAARDASSAQDASTEDEDLERLIDLYVKLNEAERNYENARGRGDYTNMGRWQEVSEGIQTEIDLIERARPELIELAQADERVISAMEAFGNAADSATKKLNDQALKQQADAAKEAEVALASLQKQMNSLTLDNPKIASLSGMDGFDADYTNALQQAKVAILELQNADNSSRDSALQNAKSKVSALQEVVASYTRAAQAARELEVAQQQATRLADKIDIWKQKNPKSYENAKAQVDQWLNTLRSGAPIASAEVKNISTEFSHLATQEKLAGTSGQTFFQQLKSGFSKFGGWTLVTRSFTKVISTFKQAVTAVKEVDAAMTELRKVTDLTEEGYRKLYDSMAQMSTKVGAKLSDTINSVANFSRLGFNAADALKLSEVALVYFNVGDELENIDEATSSIISTLKAFKIEARDAMNIVDMFNEVGNNFAISSSGIGEALQRSASALATAGNTIEESIGLIVAANDVVQNPEVVGTAMKTLSMFYRSAKTEAEEAGIATDGMVESTSKLRQELLALTGQKLDIQVNEHEYLSTFDMLKKLSEIWDEIGEVSEINQARILEMLGGKRNANVLSSILTNFHDAMAAAETAANSSGSAWAENEKYLNSIEGKTKQLQAAFETFANQVINSGVVKAFIDIQRALLEAASWLEKMGLLMPTIVALVASIKTMQSISAATKATNTVLGILSGDGDVAAKIKGVTEAISGLGVVAKQLAGQKIAEQLNKLDLDADLSAQVGNLANTMQAASFKTLTFDTVITGLKAKLSGLGKGLKTIATSQLGKFTIGLSAAIAVITIAKNAYEEYARTTIENSERIWQEQQDTANKLKEGRDTLAGIKEEYEKLAQGVDEYGNNASLTDDEYERYLELVQQILDVTPSLKNAYSEKGKALKEGYVDVLIQANEELDKLAEKSKEERYIGSRKEAEGIQLAMNQAAGTDWFGGVTGAKVQADISKIVATATKLGIEEGTQNGGQILKEALDDIELGLYDTIMKVATSDSENLYYNPRAVYMLREHLDEIRKAFQEAGVDTTTLIPMFGGLDEFWNAYSSKLVQYADLMKIVAEEADSTKAIFADIVKEGGEDTFYEGLFSMLDPSKGYDQNFSATVSWVNTLSQALHDMRIEQDELASGAKTPGMAFNDLMETYGEFPAIVKLFEHTILGVKDGTTESGEAAEGASTAYADLAKSIDAVSKAISFMDSAKSGNKSMLDMLKNAEEFVDAYNEILGDEEELEPVDISDLFVQGEDGDISWNTDLISEYTEAIIRARLENTKIAQDNPELVDAIVSEAMSMGVLEKAAVSLTDALAQMNNISELNQSIDSILAGEAKDADKLKTITDIDEIIEKWNELGKARAELSENGEEWADITREDFLGDTLDNFDLAKAKLVEFGDLIIEAFSGEDTDNSLVLMLRNVMTAGDDATKAVYEAKDALSALDSVVSMLTSGFESSDVLGSIEKANKLAEDWNESLKAMGREAEATKSFRDFLTFDPDGNLINDAEKQTDTLKKMYTDIATAAIDLDKTLTLGEKAHLKSLIPSWIQQYFDSEEVKKSAEQVKDAFSGIKDIYSYMAEVSSYNKGETSFFDLLQNAYNLAEQYEDISLGDLLKLGDDGTIDFVNVAETTLDKMITTIWDAIPAAQKAGVAFEDFSANVKDSFAEAQEEINRFEVATKGINIASSLNSFLSDYRSGNKDVLGMMSSAVSLAEDLNIEIGKLISVGPDNKLVYNVSALTDAFDAYINDLVTAGKLNEDLAAQIMNAARAEGELANETKTTAERMSDALSAMKSLYGFMESGFAGETRILDVLASAQDQFSDYQKNLEEGFTGKKLDILDFLQIDSGSVKENVETARYVYQNYADQLINAWIDEMRAANQKSGANVLFGEEEWANGLTSEQAAAIHTIRTMLKDELDELNKETEETVGDILDNLNTLLTFQAKSGESVDFSSVYDDVEKLKTILGDAGKELSITDFINWEDGDFVYKTDLLSEKISEISTKIATELVDAEIDAGNAMNDALRSEEIEKRANAIKTSIGGIADTWSQLSAAISNTKNIRSFRETIASGEGDMLDMLSDAVSYAEEFGVSLEDIVSFDAFGEMKFSADALNVVLDASIDKLVEEKLIASELAEQLKRAAYEQQQLDSTQQRLDESYSTWSSMSGTREYVEAQQLTYSQYQQLISADARYANALQYSNGQLSINAEKYNEVTAAIGKETIAVAKLRIEENKLKIHELVNEYNQLDDTQSDRAKSILSEIRKLALETQGYAVLATEIDNATSAMNRFLNASSNVNDESYDAATEAFNVIKDTLYNQDSEKYMMTGREQFKEAMKFVLGDNVEFNSDGFEQAFKAAERYLNGERSGLQNFVDDLFKFNIVDANGNLNMSLNDIAAKLGISKDAAASLLKQLNQLEGYDIDLSDETGDATEDVKSWFDQLTDLMTTIDTFEAKGVDFAVSQDTQDALTALQTQIDNINDAIQKLNAGINGGTANAPKGDQEESITTDVTTNVTTSGTEESAAALTEVQEAADSIPEQTQTTVSEEGSEGVIATLKEIIGLERQASGTVAPSSNANGLSKVKDSLSEIINKINTINSMTVQPKSGSADVPGLWTGTMRADGGRTLVGELGQEMVVDIRNGRYYTVGTHGPEIVNVPKDAIVYNHVMTAQLLGRNTASRAGARDEHGLSRATGTINPVVPGTKPKPHGGSNADDEAEKLEDILDEIKDKYEEINDDLEHLIKHLEQQYYVNERALNYDGMAGNLAAEAKRYQEIIDNCQKGIRELLAKGADDTSEQVQDLEEAMWDAYQSMYEAMDKMRALYVDALNDEIDSIQSAYSNLYNALSEYNTNGKISVDTFQALLENGIQYLSLLKNENGQYAINEQNIQKLIKARKNQLAIETALAYIGRIKEALQNNETNKVNELINATEAIGSSTWSYVYAQAALLKAQGLSNAQYEQLIQNLHNLQDLTNMVGDDTPGVGITGIKDKYEKLNEELEHYIEHQEQAYKMAERSADYVGMEDALRNKISYWQQIVANAQTALEEMKAAGATDLDADVQAMEQAIWDATENMNEAMDAIRSMLTDALSERLNDIESAFETMSSAVAEFNETGHISLSTFQSLLEGGIEYLSLLRKENGQYVVNENAIRDMIAARKEQLAIESALSYISRIREALEKGEAEKINQLADLSELLSKNSWSVVYAQLAQLKALGLSEEQYQKIIENVQSLQQIAADVSLGSADPTKEDVLDGILDKYAELNSQIEHYIKHQEFAYSQAEHALDYNGMVGLLTQRVAYYDEMMRNAMAGIEEMKAEGADDTDAALQNLEEAYWSAYNSIQDALDNIRKLKVDALTAQIDDLQSAFRNLESAASEYNERGGMTLDTFQSILSSGLQYLSLLDEQGDQYVLSADRVREYVAAEKEHLAIETALSYISNVREALQKNETERLNNLIDATNTISNNTWSYVYAQAELLKLQGLSDEMYEALLQNLQKLEAITASTIDDISSGEERISKSYDEQKKALDKILDYTEDLIKAEANDRIDAINDEIDAYKEIIELKKKSLETSKDENEYQEEVAKQVQEIAKLQAKYDMMALDDSRAAAAERLKLQEEIAEKQASLASYQQDYAYNAQVDALTEEAEAYEKSREDEIADIEASISSEEKLYQLAIARIRDQWDTLYADLIAWNTEQGNVINQEITDNWEKACAAVQEYGSYLEALNGIDIAASGSGNIIVADKLPRYHSGGVVGNKGAINDKEVMAILRKGELVIDDEAKSGLYTAVSAVEFLESLGRKIGSAVKGIGNLNPLGAFTPAFAGMATPDSHGYVMHQDVEFNASFNVAVSGVAEGSDAKRVGEQIANSAINNLYDVFNRKGISFTSKLRQG